MIGEKKEECTVYRKKQKFRSNRPEPPKILQWKNELEDPESWVQVPSCLQVLIHLEFWNIEAEVAEPLFTNF